VKPARRIREFAIEKFNAPIIIRMQERSEVPSTPGRPVRAKRPPLSAPPVATPPSPVASAKVGSRAFDCYCGLGADCELFRQMTPAQRAECARDKRAMAQSFYRSGLHV
jgi:hypothetical protein